MALRLVFEYDGSFVRLVSRDRVDAVTLPSDPLDSFEGRSGFWYEVTDGGSALLYRRVTHNPLAFASEVHDPERSARAGVAETSGVFSLLVPELRDGRQILLVGSPPGEQGLAQPASVIGVFDLTEGPIA